MAKAKGKVASLSTKSFVQGGLPTDFAGTITSAEFCRWDYNGKIDKDILAAMLTIEPDPDQDVDKDVEAYYSAGDLSKFVPSEDGEEESDSGPFAIQVGKVDGLPNSCNLASLIEALENLGWNEDTSDLSTLVGLHAHWDRVPQKERSGMTSSATGDGGQKRSNDILLPTALLDKKGKGKTAGASKGAAAKKTTGKAASSNGAENSTNGGGDELSDAVRALIVAAFEDNADGIEKKSVTQMILKSKDIDSKSKSKAVKLLSDDEFLNSGDGFLFNEEEGTLLPA